MTLTNKIKHIVQSVLRTTGYEIKRVREPLPRHNTLRIFELCAHDLMKHIDRPFVLQIGANDGIHADPIRPFITQNGWPALLIEPHHAVFQALRSNYAEYPQVRTKNVAISEHDGVMSLFVPDEAVLAENPTLSGLCSLDPEHVVKELVREGYSRPRTRMREIEVSTRTVASLLRDEGITCVDVLQIDTEGHDWRILRQFDLDALGVKLINMEFFHLSLDEQRACIQHLKGLGYETGRYLGDFIAYRMPRS